MFHERSDAHWEGWKLFIPFTITKLRKTVAVTKRSQTRLLALYINDTFPIALETIVELASIRRFINPRNSNHDTSIFSKFSSSKTCFFRYFLFFLFIYLLYFLISFPINQSQLQLIRYFNESGSTYDALNTCSFSSFLSCIYLPILFL